MSQTLYMLIGPKGAGKTTIGTLVHQHTDIAFIRVEPIWLSLQPGEDGWKKVESVIDDRFQTHDRLMIESLGPTTRSWSTTRSPQPLHMIGIWKLTTMAPYYMRRFWRPFDPFEDRMCDN